MQWSEWTNPLVEQEGVGNMVVNVEIICENCGSRHVYHYAKDPGDGDLGDTCNNCGELLRGPGRKWVTESVQAASSE